jgi:hypothetical protein
VYWWLDTAANDLDLDRMDFRVDWGEGSSGPTDLVIAEMNRIKDYLFDAILWLRDKPVKGNQHVVNIGMNPDVLEISDATIDVYYEIDGGLVIHYFNDADSSAGDINLLPFDIFTKEGNDALIGAIERYARACDRPGCVSGRGFLREPQDRRDGGSFREA